MSQQRWTNAAKGTPAASTNNLPEKLQGNEPQFVVDYFNYYKTLRGFHPNSINSNGAWTSTSPLSFMNMPLLTYIKEISTRPILLIAGENAHSRYFSEDAYKAAAGPKELMIIPNANHVDLYDRVNIIPFDKLTQFFNEHLKAGKSAQKEKAAAYGKASTAFKARLPITVNMRELNGNEKYFDLAASLPANASNPGTIQNGDLMLYGAKTLVLFYKSFPTTYPYTKIGRINDPAGLAAAVGTGEVEVTFELALNK